MKFRLCLLSLLAAAPLTFAQEDRSVTIEPPAPASYSSDRPAYLFFKKIVITRKAKSIYDFNITLQGDLPPNPGVQYIVAFDFANIKTEGKHLTIGSFSSDMMIQIYRTKRDLKFTSFMTDIVMKQTKRNYDLNISALSAHKDKITFSLRSNIFDEDMVTQVVLRSGLLDQAYTTGAFESIGNGQTTKPTGLNAESNQAEATPSPTPASDEPPKPESINSLLKP